MNVQIKLKLVTYISKYLNVYHFYEPGLRTVTHSPLTQHYFIVHYT